LSIFKLPAKVPEGDGKQDRRGETENQLKVWRETICQRLTRKRKGVVFLIPENGKMNFGMKNFLIFSGKIDSCRERVLSLPQKFFDFKNHFFAAFRRNKKSFKP